MGTHTEEGGRLQQQEEGGLLIGMSAAEIRSFIGMNERTGCVENHSLA